MDARIKRIVAWMLLAAALYVIATFATESRIAFAVIFGAGLSIGLAADLMFLTHLFRLPRNRRRR